MLVSKLAGRGSFLLPLISASLLLLGASTYSKCSRPNLPIGQQEAAVTEIYAEADWYRERSEPEKEWRGVLREREVKVGPATRTALTYKLVRDDQELPIYAANVAPKLAPFVGRQVLIRGKLVDLSKEGFGRELWIASIRADERGFK
jgi:hypothetical protein